MTISLHKSKSSAQKAVSVAFAAATGLVVFSASAPAYALTWNWQFAAPPLASGSGTFTTNGTTATAGATYTISSLSGSYTYLGNTYTDLVLSGDNGASNTFQWNGTNSSPIISNLGGIAFRYNSGAALSRIRVTSSINYMPVDNLEPPDYNISSSSLTPVSAPVPGPIPVFGAAAALCWSRRLRRKIKKAEAGKVGSTSTVNLA